MTQNTKSSAGNIIITGVTGMVGEGVLLTCLENPAVNKILVVGRRSCGYTHPKLSELVVKDLAQLSPAEAHAMAGYDACFFCAGVSSVGKSEDEFRRLTYDLTISFAEKFKQANPGTEPVFCYVSGYGTDSTEKGKTMWARVKGRTENRLIEMFGKGAHMFRPGYMKPVKGQKNVLKFYIGWQMFYPVMKTLLPKFTCTLEDVGNAMINCALGGPGKNVLEVKDIIQTANK